MAKLPKPTPIEIQQNVDQSLSDYYGLGLKRSSLLINIEALLENVYDISIVPTIGLEKVHSVNSVMAADFKTIFVDLHQYEDPNFSGNLRHSLAHELGHLKLHRYYFQDNTEVVDEMAVRRFHFDDISHYDYRDLEKQADSFAGGVLVPRDYLVVEAILLISDKLDILYDNNVTVSKLLEALAPRLAKKFDVPDELVLNRIIDEDIARVIQLDPNGPFQQETKQTIRHRLVSLLDSFTLIDTIDA